MSIEHLWTYEQYWYTDDSITRTLEVTFDKYLCVAWGTISATSVGSSGNVGIRVKKYKTRDSNGNETSHSYNWPDSSRIRVENCVSVTFETFIYASGGYIVTTPIVTLWG